MFLILFCCCFCVCYYRKQLWNRIVYQMKCSKVLGSAHGEISEVSKRKRILVDNCHTMPVLEFFYIRYSFSKHALFYPIWNLIRFYKLFVVFSYGCGNSCRYILHSIQCYGHFARLGCTFVAGLQKSQ